MDQVAWSAIMFDCRSKADECRGYSKAMCRWRCKSGVGICEGATDTSFSSASFTTEKAPVPTSWPNLYIFWALELDPRMGSSSYCSLKSEAREKPWTLSSPNSTFLFIYLKLSFLDLG